MDFNTADELVREYISALDSSTPQYVSERDIAEKFQMNRSNSRKLLLKLEGEGLLECLPQRGYRRVDYSNTTQRTYFTMRSVTECEAVRLAATRATREDILRLMLILEEADEVIAAKKWDKFPPLDGDFHRALIAAAHDNMLSKLFSFLYMPQVNLPTTTPQLIQDTHKTHKRVFEAFRGGDIETAVTILATTHFGNKTDIPYDPENKFSPTGRK